jgi:7,8-dihydropterin-6-yl-methyl-4-(beta-D-ribofuranosyl)aminobenzene 5'-phosphate synthase
MAERVSLRPVDAAEVTIVVDNSIDILMSSTEVAKRLPLAWDSFERDQLRAEHGYALLLTVAIAGRREHLLYDAGLGRETAIHNLDVLGLDPKDFRTMVLSHGHADHHGGLEGLYRRIGRPGMPLVLHPDAWRERKVVFPTGVEMRLPPPSHQDLDREGWQVVEERGPSLLLEGTVLVTGQVERETDFEKASRSSRHAPTAAGSRTSGFGTTRRWSSTSGTGAWSSFPPAATPASSTSCATPGG